MSKNNFNDKVTNREKKSRVGAILTARDEAKETGNKKNEIVQAIEKRSKQASILLAPTTHKKAMEKAKNLGISFNEVVNQLLESFIED